MDKNTGLNAQFEQLELKNDNGVVTIILKNPPVNVLSGTMMKELHQIMALLRDDATTKVIIFESADPDFFLAHVDINILEEKDILDALGQITPEGINIFQHIGILLQNQPQVTIVKLKGIARGGGAEFVAAADMSFASIEKGKLAQCEALMGIIPGGGATQFLSRKMSRNRVLEIILGADLFDAFTAEKYGWINRAIAEEEIDDFVNRLAKNIADLPVGVVQTVKNILKPSSNAEGFSAENKGWEKLAFTPNVGKILSQAVANGAQTKEGEWQLETLLRDIL